MTSPAARSHCVPGSSCESACRCRKLVESHVNVVLLGDDHALTANASLERIADEALALCKAPLAHLGPAHGWRVLCAGLS